jgi:hypothetical protein
MRKKKGKWDTLESVLDEIWIMLTRGASRFTDPFHWPVLGSIGKDVPNLRMVILRKVMVPERILVCHTDARAPKVQEIRDAERVCWLFYHPKKMVQLRITGTATLHTDDPLAEEQWAAARPTSRLNYCAVEPPGTPIDRPSSGLPDFLLKKVPTLLQTQRGRKHFMAIACRMDVVDWLILRPTGNTRARFIWSEEGLTSTWIVP